MSYYSVDYSASGQVRLSVTKIASELRSNLEMPAGAYDLVHSPLKHLAFFRLASHMPRNPSRHTHED
jgi:hypothetical protein